jgi:hypothetical protein
MFGHLAEITFAHEVLTFTRRMRRKVVRISLVVGATVIGPLAGFVVAKLPGVIGCALCAAAVDAWQFLELERELDVFRERTRPLRWFEQTRADDQRRRGDATARRAADPRTPY